MLLVVLVFCWLLLVVLSLLFVCGFVVCRLLLFVDCRLSCVVIRCVLFVVCRLVSLFVWCRDFIVVCWFLGVRCLLRVVAMCC